MIKGSIQEDITILNIHIFKIINYKFPIIYKIINNNNYINNNI